MDPMTVVRVLWHHKWVALPFALTAIALSVGALFFGPRTYQATSTFAMITPALPSPTAIQADPRLAALTDNPYLRSTDPTLALEAARTRLSSGDAATTLTDEGLSTQFAVGQGTAASSQILAITADAADPDVAVATAIRLGELLDREIRDVQTVNGASEEFTITVQPLTVPTGATEKVSSRLRTAAVAGIGGLVLLVCAVSIARGVEAHRAARVSTTAPTPDGATATADHRPEPTRARVGGPSRRFQPAPLR
ncbi:chain-length determining protein [Rhodococcus kroppenstedtii]|uniref:hypothetical protein n=1 Tax=Rhodococcoides kroppenstedtii TaxID=293050 RepID=UPI001C9B58A2|nr:hypothetical protein [Rhodococcus kroppenstedtii]MBY6436597.1 chain-length determining protein [Rhodococcus kroppenstedtii]